MSAQPADPERVSLQSQADGGIVAELRLDHEELLLRPTLRRTSSVSIEIEYWTVVEGGRTVVFFGAEGEEFETLEKALETDPTITEPTLVDQYPETRVYRVTLTDRAIQFMGRTAEAGGRILDISSGADGWIVQLRFPDRDGLMEFNRFCQRTGISFHVNHLRLAKPGERAVLGLTQKQEELLSVAYEEGYFNVPRGISQDELAKKLGVSKSAVSQRLRRAMNELCESSLANGG